MSWAEPGWGVLLLAVAALAVVLALATAAHHRRLGAIFGQGPLLDRVLPPSVRRRRRARDVLALLGVACLVIALAEPRFGKRLRSIEAEGVDLVIAVDLSRSMDAQDVDPSRLERARREILDLMELLAGDRVGLVMFAGGAYPRMPLTLDYRALELIVRELDTRAFQAQGSALGLAIRESLTLLANQRGDAGQAILVLTDGEVHEPDDAMAAAREARDAGVPVFGMVVGVEAAPIPNGDGTFLADPTTGDRVLTLPTMEVLTDVARLTGGAVVRSVPSNADVVALYRDDIRSEVRAAVGARTQRETWTSAFQWPLGAGLLLLLAAGWLGDGRARHAGLAAALLLAILPAAAHAQDVRDADQAYREGRWHEAVRILTDLSLERPDDPDLLDRLGAARYRAGDFVGAARAWERAAAQADDPDARFNAGNAWYRSGHLDRAVDRYDQVLTEAPDHEGAAANRDLVLQELELRRQLQEQLQPEQAPSEEGDEGQDGDQGEPQDGEGQPGEQEGDSRQGDQGGDPSDPQQDGSPSDGADQQEDQGGQEQAGDPTSQGTPPEQQGEQRPGQAEGPPDDGTREEGQGDGQAALDDIRSGEGDEQAEGGSPGGGGSDAPPHTPTGMTREQASRVLDGVEEGRPRVYIPGERSARPW